MIPALLVWPRGNVPPTVKAFVDLVRAEAKDIARSITLPVT
jgi:hypothetical protein